jgi:4-amino-4-deoxy-L-arabinose transferase-like glycosyltransferase
MATPIVILLVALGAALRLAVAGQSVFADELSTYWIVSTNGLSGAVSTVHTDAEITPPLYFVTAWISTRLDLSPELLRAPSLLAGIACIPLTYLLGRRTVGQGPATVAAAITALAPFMIFYSTEARGYALAVALVLGSTVALLAAVDGERPTRWWVVYGACSCAAVYTHYTAVFPLAAQLGWLMWAHPEARRVALLANALAAIAFLPWLSGLINDFTSPTTDILDALSPFTARAVRISLQHWSVGYPLVLPGTGLRELPGTPALVLLGLGLVVAAGGALAHGRPARIDSRLVLVLVLALSAPLGEALVSAIGTNLFGTRNLAVSWPGFALSLSALALAAGPRLGVVAAGLVVSSFAIGAVKMLEPRFHRPGYDEAAAFVERASDPGDVIVDDAAVGVTPGPLTGLDVPLDGSRRPIRVGVPQQRERPFAIGDPIVPVSSLIRPLTISSGPRRIVAVTGDLAFARRTGMRIDGLPVRYRLVEERTIPGVLTLTVQVYADPAQQPG